MHVGAQSPLGPRSARKGASKSTASHTPPSLGRADGVYAVTRDPGAPKHKEMRVMAEHCRGRSSTFKPCNRYLLPLVLPLVLWSQQILAQVERVSVGLEGTQGNGNSLEPALSTDGRFVAFLSQATNLVAGDTNGPAGFQVFVHDRQTGLTERVSIASDGTPADAGSLGLPSRAMAASWPSTATPRISSQEIPQRHTRCSSTTGRPE